MPAGAYLGRLLEMDLSGNQFGPGLPPSLAGATGLKALGLEGNAAALGAARATLLAALPALRESGGLLLPAPAPGHASA